jgi:acyl-CoA synthetase (AMP-forming)/AMP-acid ligase II
MTTNDLFLRSCYRYPDKICLIDGERKSSYREVNRESNRFADAMRGLGVKKGDKVALLSKDRKEFVYAYIGLSKIGAVMVTLNYRSVARELEYILKDCGAGVLVFEGEYANTVAQMRDHLLKVSHYVSLDECDLGFAEFNDGLLAMFNGKNPNVEVSEDDDCAIIYTSGTTGNPKGAVMTHRSRVSCTTNILLDGSIEEDGVCLIGSPLFHAGALNIGLLPHLSFGGAVVVIPNLHPEEIAKTVEREKVTHIVTVPTIIHNLLAINAFEHFDFSSLRKVYYGGAAITLRDLELVLDRLPKAEFYQGYGSTEATQLTVLKPEYQMRKIGCTGKPHVFVDLRVVNEDDRDVLPEHTGEIVTRGPHVMKEYFNLPDETEESFRNGWFHTGDMARIDKEGFITIVDRKKDVIISGGENIYPKEIENVLYGHPKIKEAAVFGVPDAKWGEAVCAAVILTENESLTEEEIVSYCKENLASYKKPQTVRFFESFPKNTLGKIQKDKLKEAV